MVDMKELAEHTVKIAKKCGIKLDYTSESLPSLDAFAQMIFRENCSEGIPENVRVSMAAMIGAYLGEVLLRSGLNDLGYDWMKDEKGEIGIGCEDAWVAPLTKVYKRITEGPHHDLITFFDTAFGMAIGAYDENDRLVHFLSCDDV